MLINIIKRYYIEIGVFLLLFFMYLSEFLTRWLPNWLDADSFYAFGFFIIGFLIYLFKTNINSLKTLITKPKWYGLVFILTGFVMYVIGIRADVYYLISLSLIMFLYGIILCFWGIKIFKKAFIPVTLLGLTLPILPMHRITLPLQSFSTLVSTGIFNILGVPAFNEGNIINIIDKKISVEPGCSGVKSLFNLFFISIIYSYFVDINLRTKMLIIISTLPFAIILNIIRITFVGFYVLYRGYEGSYEFHDIFGTILLGLAVLLIIFIFKSVQESNEYEI